MPIATETTAMRNLLCIILSLLICQNALAAPASTEVIAFAKGVKPGQTVVVKLVNKEKVKGTFISASDSAVEIMAFKGRQEARRAIPYGQIKSIGKPTPGWAWVTLGVVVGVAVLLIVGLAYAESA